MRFKLLYLREAGGHEVVATGTVSGTLDGVPATDVDLLELLFMHYNGHDEARVVPTHRLHLGALRSLSVGDVVDLDGKLFECSPIGWKPIGAEDVTLHPYTPTVPYGWDRIIS